MRAIFTIFFCLVWIASLWAQPANDECVNATNLTLSTPAPCPSTAPASNFFVFDNIDATPTTPYPTFTGCDPGGVTMGPAAEVWFTFTATTNTTDITISGLNNPQAALFTGNACDFLNPNACGSAAGSLTMTVNTLVGTTYFLMVSGEDVDDQGVFDLSFDSYNDCNPCLLGNEFTVLPPPINGTYSSGSTVTFCFTINQWDVTGTIEWFHAITFDLGSGWDPTTLAPTVTPPSCGGDGSWGYYDSWTGCNTGQTFGPGFAYDSASGVGCGGSPNDGDPGNNWGDGVNGCSTITPANPVQFCWSVQVTDCPPNANGADLSMVVNVWSDGDSGSWTQTGCNSGTTFDFLASAVCCNDGDPIAFSINTSCPGATNGSIEVTGGDFPISGDAYNFFLFDLGGLLIDEALGVVGPHTFTDLAAGLYSIQAVNSLSGCSRSITIEVFEDLPPEAIASQLPACLGDPINLTGDVIPGDPSATYEWTGPDGTFIGQNVTVNTPGSWTLVVTSNNCPSDPVTINVVAEEIITSASADPLTVCENQAPVTLSATGDPSFLYDWGIYGVGQNIIVPSLATTTTFTVTVTNPVSGCSAEADVTVNVNPLPPVSIIDPGPICQGSTVVLEATGASTYVWEDGQTGPIASYTFDQAGQTTITVVGTDAFGCVNNFTLQLFVVSPPDGAITPDAVTICTGESVTLTASGGINYSWSTGQGSDAITVMPTNTFQYTVTITDVNGCEDIETVTVTVDQPNIPPTIVCTDETPSSVTFSWDDVGGAYDIVVTTGQTGTQNGTTFTVDNLSPGEDVTIELTSVSGNSCPDQTVTATCSAEACPNVNVDINNAPMSVCLGDATTIFDLDITLTGDNGNGTTVWSGTGITDTDAGIFDANNADIGANVITVTYSEQNGQCPYTDMVTINVFETPTADFLVSNDNFCSTENITVTYDGSASSMADYDWNFDGGSVISGSGQGPYVVEYDTEGSYTISLVVEENGCESDPFTVNIDVQEPLPAPTIICESATTTEVVFSWTDIPGAESYSVTILSGQTGGVLNGTTYTVGGLMPNESVEIEVVAVNSGPCGSSSSTQTCTSDECPIVDITLMSPQNDICLEAFNVPFNLTAEIVGGQGAGSGVWSGPGILDGNTGTFDPSVAMEGSHVITFTYTEAGPCEYTADITINVFDVPTADFTIDPANICVNGGSTTVTYTGDADVNNATFNWTFNGGNANPTTGPGPITVDWPVAGPRTITLTVIENGCTSETVSQTVQVESPLEEPMIQCGNATTTSVEFVWADVAGAVGYTVNVITGQTGVLNGTTYTVDNLMPGEVVLIEVIAEGNGACGNSSAQFTCEALQCPNFVVDITIPLNDICLDGMASPFDLSATVNGGTGGGTVNWSGTGITDASAGTFDPVTAMEGAHDITFTYTEGPCSVTEIVTINVFDVPTADFSLSANLVCINDEVTVEYTGDADLNNATISWNFSGGNASATTGAGPITVSWPAGGVQTITLTVTENGCTASSSQDVTVEEPLAAPVINCMSTTSSITFTWDDVTGASSYTVTVLQGASGTQNGNSYEVTGLNPGDLVEIQVEAVGTGPCGSSFATLECIAEDCPNIVIDLPVVDAICLDASATTIDLDATLTGDNGMGTETWSGPGITDEAAGIFDPSVAMVGNHVISYTYQEGNCTYNGSLTIVVNPQPTADFTVETPICIDGTSIVSFTGSAGAMATYDWNFDDGVIVSGSDAGPYEISFPTSGSKNITLTVTDNGCASDEFTQTIDVEDPLPAPVISCNSTNTSITFSWEDIAGASGFDLVPIFGEAGTLNGNSYEVTGLEPGDSVRIRVIALDSGPCADVFSELTCYAQDCPDITVTIDPVDALCSNDAVQTLNANASAGMGTFTWSGTGITDADAGTFDPSVVIDGTVTISVVYTEGVCTYTSSIDITVNKQPTADFTAVSPVCTDQNSNVVYTGTGGPTATYDWNFDGGTIVSGTGSGPYNISWADSGTKTITLTVTEDGCPSEEFTQTVEVEEPLAAPNISCDSDNTSITFLWDDIPGAQGFDIELIFGTAGVINGNSYEVTGLEPGDSVRIRVIALNDGPCGNTETSITCYAQDCPDITVTIDPVADLCQDAGLQTLTASASAGMGTFTWSGMGIIDADAGTFDPTAFDGTETITVTYLDGVCSYTGTVDITVFEVPTSNFMVEDVVVCTGQVTEIDYTGTAGSAATYDWDFDGGNADPGGTAQGPHDISWDSPGIKTITLQVTEDGCVSDVFTMMVEVQQPLDMPVISCDSDNTSITFSWDDVAGAEGYEVNVLTGQTGTLNGNTFTITGMMPGEFATIEVVALDSGPCGNIVSEITCIAADCPDRVVEISDPGPLCADAGIITLTATIDGMPGSGTYVFTGPGIVNGMDGTFNPALVAGNTVTVTATYTEDVCTYTGSIQITVNQVPIAAFMASSPICVDATSTVEFTGTASGDATYVWDFDGGMGGTGAGPFDVSWTDAGTKTITLTVIDNGCESETITQTVQVDPLLAEPIINCNTTNTSIEFVWNDVAGATSYDVAVLSGQTGTLNGTSFLVDGLMPGEEVTITVTAIGDGACGNSMATATCVAQDCPGFDATMVITESICLGISDNPTITFTFDTTSDGPFMVDFLNETTGVQNSITVTNGQTITLDDITETSTITFVSYSDTNLADCVYPGNQTEVITVSIPVNAGTADQPSQLCVGTAETISLIDLVLNGDLGGQWSETSANPSTGGAFNAANGTLNTGNLAPGTYTFEYLLDAAAPCEDQSVTVEVLVNEEPVADAGETMTLTCNMGMVNIGGNNTSSGAGITYQWTADDPMIIIANPDIAFPEVSQPGMYTLTVTNEFGCTTTDVVEVTANFDVPVAEIAISEISCFEANDGAITISNVTGGAGGYQYSLNGGPFTTTPQFGNLGPDDYSLVIQDANGCFSELMIGLSQPTEVTVSLTTNLGPDNIISLGDSVRLEAVFDPSLNIDTLIWQPDSIAKGNSPVVFVNPTTATTYSVTLIDENGCSDTDQMMVLVRKERPVFIPNVFSPNEDGFNDIFYIQGGEFIKEIKTFQVYNRWGESVLELFNFQPNDPSFGWDGTYRGQPVNPAVYVWFAEIEFDDGEVILYKGDVAVMK